MINPSKCQMIGNFRGLQDHQTNGLLDKAQLLPEIPCTTSLQLEFDMPNTTRSISDTNIPPEVRTRLKELLDAKNTSIVSKSATDISRTNLIELDIPTEGPPIAAKPYRAPLKHRGFFDQEIKHFEEAGTIFRSMSNWARPILVVPKKEECIHSNTSTSTNKNNKFNLSLCIDYGKLNS